MKLLLDVDGVLANFRLEVVRLASKRWPKRTFKIGDWTDFSPWVDDCPFPLHTEAEFRMLHDRVQWENLVPTDEMPEMRELARSADYVRVVTARPLTGNIQDATREWLEQHEIPYREIVFAPNGTKWRWAQGMTHVVDDCDNEIKRMLEKFPRLTVIPMPRPYNTQRKDSENDQR